MPIRVLAVAAVGVVLAAVVAVALASGGGDEPSADQKRACVYSEHRVSRLAEFQRLAGRDIDCAVVFNDASPDWRAWERPWFLGHRDPNLNWRRWKAADDGRSLVITQNLFPAAVNKTDWLAAGSRGDFEGHARALARNLVKAGLGDATIRLAHEANGTTYPYSLGDSPDDRRRWREFWRRTVLAMRSVDGADFKFDWCVLAAYRPIPLREWYPGDDVVDIVGIDAYDSGIEQQGPGRWRTIYTRPLGVRDVLRFARAHGKPLSIPEWGVGPVGNQLAGGDNAAYVRGIGRVVHDNPTSYQAYFYARQWRDQLRRGPASRAAYRKSFREH